MGYQCQLASAANSAVAPALLHNWRACNASDAYGGLPDGSYVWKVRATGVSARSLLQGFLHCMSFHSFTGFRTAGRSQLCLVADGSR